MCSKEKCKYWQKCFRKDKKHLEEFMHPDKSSASAEEKGKKGLGGNDDLKNKKIVFIGSLKKSSFAQAVARAKVFGCIVENSLNKTIDAVVIGEEEDERETKAQEIGLQCLTEDEWESLLAKSKPVQGYKASHRNKDVSICSDSEDEGFEPGLKAKKIAAVGKKIVTAGNADTPSLERKSSLRKSTSSTASLKRKSSRDDFDKTSLERKNSLRRQSTVELDNDKTDEKPKLKKRKTHEISILGTEDSGPTAKKLKLKKKSSDTSVTMDTEPKAKVNATKGTPTGTVKKPKCKYWSKCYRKDANHKKQFLHLGDPVPDDDINEDMEAAGPSCSKTRASTRPKPKNIMADGDVEETGGHRLKRIGSHFYCTCPGWKNQNKPLNKRTCKHLRDHLGDEYECARCEMTPVKKAKGIPSHIQVSVLLAHKYEGSNVNPTGWWMSEKLDGVRAFWNGRCFYSRLGNAFLAPYWFTKDLPVDMHLDGELFGGRGKFQSTVSIVKNGKGEEAWKKISYHIFDAPNLEKESFEKRIEAIKKYFDENKTKWAIMVDHQKCKGKEQIEVELKRVIKLGGEGLMIREPGSKYERRRSRTLLKIKKFYDAEAIIIGYEPGKGRFHNAVGALRCRMACGKVFKVGSGLSDHDHRHPPKIGTIISYKFQEYTNSGSPRFPSYLGIRIDMDKPKDADVVKKPDDA